jgi:hypothetical protein
MQNFIRIYLAISLLSSISCLCMEIQESPRARRKSFFLPPIASAQDSTALSSKVQKDAYTDIEQSSTESSRLNISSEESASSISRQSPPRCIFSKKIKQLSSDYFLQIDPKTISESDVLYIFQQVEKNIFDSSLQKKSIALLISLVNQHHQFIEKNLSEWPIEEKWLIKLLNILMPRSVATHYTEIEHCCLLLINFFITQQLSSLPIPSHIPIQAKSISLFIKLLKKILFSFNKHPITNEIIINTLNQLNSFFIHEEFDEETSLIINYATLILCPSRINQPLSEYLPYELKEFPTQIKINMLAALLEYATNYRANKTPSYIFSHIATIFNKVATTERSNSTIITFINDAITSLIDILSQPLLDNNDDLSAAEKEYLNEALYLITINFYQHSANNCSKLCNILKNHFFDPILSTQTSNGILLALSRAPISTASYSNKVSLLELAAYLEMLLMHAVDNNNEKLLQVFNANCNNLLLLIMHLTHTIHSLKEAFTLVEYALTITKTYPNRINTSHCLFIITKIINKIFTIDSSKKSHDYIFTILNNTFAIETFLEQSSAYACGKFSEEITPIIINFFDTTTSLNNRLLWLQIICKTLPYLHKATNAREGYSRSSDIIEQIQRLTFYDEETESKDFQQLSSLLTRFEELTK